MIYFKGTKKLAETYKSLGPNLCLARRKSVAFELLEYRSTCSVTFLLFHFQLHSCRKLSNHSREADDWSETSRTWRRWSKRTALLFVSSSLLHFRLIVDKLQALENKHKLTLTLVFACTGLLSRAIKVVTKLEAVVCFYCGDRQSCQKICFSMNLKARYRSGLWHPRGGGGGG